MSLLDVGIVVLILAPILPAAASFVLVRHWSADSVSLRERTILAIRDWVVATIAALIAISRLLQWSWPPPVTFTLLYAALLLVSIPSAYWLVLYSRGYFNEKVRGRKETPLEREDREVGDTRRELQAKAEEHD